MSYRAAALALVLGLFAVLLWRHELFTGHSRLVRRLERFTD